MNNNYILARWRDAITDPPPEGKPRLVKSHHGVIQHVLFERIGSRWTHADLELGDSGWDGCDIEPGDQWLDITAIPGVAREVCSCPIFIPGSMDINNRIILSEVHYAEPYGQPPWMYCPWCGGTVWRAVTGITPTEVL